MLWISSLLSRPTFFCFLYSPVGHVFLPTTAPEALLLVWSAYRTGFSLLLAEESGHAASDNGGDTVALADDSAVQESELAVDGAGLAALPSCAHI